MSGQVGQAPLASTASARYGLLGLPLAFVALPVYVHLPNHYAQQHAVPLAALPAGIDPAQPSGLEYYPLPGPGERFPIADPAQAPRETPRRWCRTRSRWASCS